jgi:hypothetical protein
MGLPSNNCAPPPPLSLAPRAQAHSRHRAPALGCATPSRAGAPLLTDHPPPPPLVLSGYAASLTPN